MKSLYRIVSSFLLTLALTGPAWAQTQLNTTTLAAAVTASQTSITVTSATGVVAGGGVYIGREFMRVGGAYVSGTVVPVMRAGRAVAHVAGQPVHIGPAIAFINTDRDGACVPAAEAYLPQINVDNGKIWNCHAGAGQWIDERGAVVVTCRALLVADQIDQSCFTAERAFLVFKITYVATTAEAAGTLTIIPKRQQGTEAPAAGDALATAINAVTSGVPAETVHTATLTASGELLMLHAGNRLALDYTGDVASELAGVVVTWFLYPL